MQGPVTLTAEEFKEIHNALWNLREINDRLEEVISENIYLANRKVESTIRKALANAYKQEEKIFKEKLIPSLREEPVWLKPLWSGSYDTNSII